MTSKPLKQKYRGVFTGRKTRYLFYRYATSEHAAWSKMCKAISDKDLVPLEAVRESFAFDDRKNFTLELVEKERKELK